MKVYPRLERRKLKRIESGKSRFKSMIERNEYTARVEKHLNKNMVVHMAEDCSIFYGYDLDRLGKGAVYSFTPVEVMDICNSVAAGAHAKFFAELVQAKSEGKTVRFDMKDSALNSIPEDKKESPKVGITKKLKQAFAQYRIRGGDAIPAILQEGAAPVWH